MLAKHNGVYTSIKPGWCKANNAVHVIISDNANNANVVSDNANNVNVISDNANNVNVDNACVEDEDNNSNTNTVNEDNNSNTNTVNDLHVNDTTASTDNISVICNVCGITLIDEQALYIHMHEGINPDNYAICAANSNITTNVANALDCPLCNRPCRDQRSYQQHYNYCNSKSKQPTL